MVDVVDEPDDDAALLRLDQGLGDERGCLVVEADVVERELECPLGGAQELGDLACDVGGGLAAVAVRPELDHALAARNEALNARFAAWYSARASGESTSPSIGWFGTSGSAISLP